MSAHVLHEALAEFPDRELLVREAASDLARLAITDALDGMVEPLSYGLDGTVRAATDAIDDAVGEYYLTTTDRHGNPVQAFPVYQMNTPNHPWAYDRGKASPDKLRAKVSGFIGRLQAADNSLHIPDAESFRLFFEAFGYGVDCSKLASHVETEVHRRLGLPDYASTVFWHGADVLAPYVRPRDPWRALDERGAERELSTDEMVRFESNQPVAVSELCRIFGREPGKTMNAAHMCSDLATVPVGPHEALPGDLIAWKSKKHGRIAHVAVVDKRLVTDTIVAVSFWHSWDPQSDEPSEPSGIRRDRMGFDTDGRLIITSHPALVTDNYAVGLRRPNALADHYSAVAA